MTQRSVLQNSFVRYWLLIVGWCVIGTIFTLQSYIYRIHVGQNITWWGIYPGEVFYFISWGMCTPLIVRFSRAYRVHKHQWRISILKQLGIALVFAVAHRIIYEYLLQNLKATTEHPFELDGLIRNVIGFSDYGFFIYLIIAFIDHARWYYKELLEEQLHAARLKEELTAAQLQALKMQIQPHFLFNSLNTVSVLIQEEPKKAEKTLLMISDLLRLTLKRAEQVEISLQEELRYAELYLHIEQVRFGDRLKVSIHAENEVLDAGVPSLILQPLVENAIKHGISQKRGDGVVSIDCKKATTHLEIQVKDNGVGLSFQDSTSETGIGLSNISSRLRAIYGEQAVLSIADADGGGTIATLRIPYHSVKAQ